MVRVSIRTSWVVNFALFHCYRTVIYTRHGDRTNIDSADGATLLSKVLAQTN